MDPASAMLLGGAAVSTGLSIFGTKKQTEGIQQEAQATSTAAAYRAQVARNNADLAEINAVSTINEGSTQAFAHSLKVGGVVGAQRAQQGASGIDIDSPTAVGVRQTATEMGHLDALTIMYNAMSKARGFRTQGFNFGQQAGLEDMAGYNALAAGKTKADASIIGGAASVADKWLSFARYGVGTGTGKS
jgi:hypothetical protein